MRRDINKKYGVLAQQISRIGHLTITPDGLMMRALENYYNHKTQYLAYKLWRKKVFDEIYERDGGMCLWCHSPIKKYESTLDHLIPVDRGGRMMKMSNVVICCRPCNNDKGNLTPDEYMCKLMSRNNART